MKSLKVRLSVIVLMAFTVFAFASPATVQAINTKEKMYKSKAAAKQATKAATSDQLNSGEEELVGNLWIQTNQSDFNKGTNQGTIVTKAGDGGVQLIKEKGRHTSGGVYTSEIIKTSPFEYLVLSWNADTPKSTSIKIEGQARIKGQWSNWLSWGTWGSLMARASASWSDASDDLAYVDTDTYTVRGSDGETADAFRYRITLLTDDTKETPTLRLVAAALYNSMDGQTINKVHNDGITQVQLDNLNKILDVPSFSQVVRDPMFAWYICSPTSMAMLMKYRGINVIPEQTAMGIYDSAYDGYGNWPFNTAYAGSLGLTSYIEYMNSMNDIKREIINGNPVALSVKYRNDESVDKWYPVIHGAPIPSTGGHLIIVCGFTKGQDGKDYAVVNDPASPDNASVNRRYLVSELDAAWETSGRVTYIVHAGADKIHSPEVHTASFVSTNSTRTVDGKLYKEYKLLYKGVQVDLNKAVDPNNPYYERGISIMYSMDGGDYEYITPTDDKTLWFDTTKPAAKYNFLIFRKTGDSYSAVLNTKE